MSNRQRRKDPAFRVPRERDCIVFDQAFAIPGRPEDPPVRIRRRLPIVWTDSQLAAWKADLYRAVESGKLDEWREGHDSRFRGGKRRVKPQPAVHPDDLPPATVAELCERYMEGYVKLRNKPSVWASVRGHLDAIRVAFGKWSLDKLTSPACARWIRELAEAGKSPPTVNMYRATLSGLLRWAVDMRWLATNPVSGVAKLADHRPEEDTGARRAMTIDEERIFIRACGKLPVPYDTLFAVMLYTGMRLGEALALRWDSVDLERRVLTVRRSMSAGQETTPKSGKSRTFPIPAVSVPWFEKQRARGPDDAGRVFPGYVSGKALDAGTVSKRFAALVVDAGFTNPQGITLHSLRHTFATRLVEGGAPASAIRDFLGHSSVAVSDRYLHTVEGTLRNAVESPQWQTQWQTDAESTEAN